MEDLLQDIEQTRVLAADPKTNSKVLRMLEKSSDKLTREAVVNNPNTPTDVLLRLGAEFPEQLVNNPIFSMLILENLNFVEKIPLSTLRSLLELKNVPEYILEKAVNKLNVEAQLELTNGNKTSKAVLHLLTKNGYNLISQPARLHVNFAGEITEGYKEKVKQELKIVAPYYQRRDRDLELLAQIKPILETIIQYWEKCPELDKILAQSQAIDPNILKQLANHSDEDIRLTIAQNPNTPEETLRELAKNQQTKYFVALNENTPSYILETLAKYESASVRLQVAQNMSTPLTVLENLAQDSDVKIAQMANQNLLVRQNPYNFLVFKEYETFPNGLENFVQQAPPLSVNILTEMSISQDL